VYIWITLDHWIYLPWVEGGFKLQGLCGFEEDAQLAYYNSATALFLTLPLLLCCSLVLLDPVPHCRLNKQTPSFYSGQSQHTLW
jgi:hypothetical protein